MRFIKKTQIGWVSRLLILSLLLGLVGIAFASVPRATAAPAQEPPGPDRYSVTVVDYTKYTWWLFRWSKPDLIQCTIETDHEGLPTPDEIFINCGADIFNRWLTQKPCNRVDVTQCKGFYVYLANSEPAQKEISTKLPPATVQVTLENCDPVYTSFTSICGSQPILVLTGTEPLSDYKITSIEGLYQGQSFTCDAVCRLQLPVTDDKGFTIQFWANSSYGDSSEMFEALVRVAVTDVGNPDRSFWYVDVLSSQWAGVPVASCVQAWGTLPPVGGPPEWLSTPTKSESLGTDISYNYLAAHLIRAGAVDVLACADSGLSADGSASACGMEAARGDVTAWQNQFDGIILNVAKDTGIPAHLLKNLFAAESQFWPGRSLRNDIGLGQLTETGADITLLWNPAFYYQFCPTVMDSTECSKGYLHLTTKQQEYLRQALIAAVDATCDTCPLGISLDRANFGVGVFAHTLLASCEQAGQLVENITGGQAGDAASYEDLWKFTLANYNAGPGCLGNALDATDGASQDLTWDNVSSHLEPACQGALNYVNSISQ